MILGKSVDQQKFTIRANFFKKFIEICLKILHWANSTSLHKKITSNEPYLVLHISKIKTATYIEFVVPLD